MSVVGETLAEDASLCIIQMDKDFYYVCDDSVLEARQSGCQIRATTRCARTGARAPLIWFSMYLFMSLTCIYFPFSCVNQQMKLAGIVVATAAGPLCLP